jgi:hypothetical protein
MQMEHGWDGPDSMAHKLIAQTTLRRNSFYKSKFFVSNIVAVVV